MQAMLDRGPGVRHYFSGKFNTYGTLGYYPGRHKFVGDKSRTYSVEANNAKLRHYSPGRRSGPVASRAACRRYGGRTICLSFTGTDTPKSVGREQEAIINYNCGITIIDGEAIEFVPWLPGSDA